MRIDAIVWPVLLLLCACMGRPQFLQAPVFVVERHLGDTGPALRKVAIAPLYAERPEGGGLQAESDLEQGGQYVQHLLAQALQSRGIKVVAAADVAFGLADEEVGIPYENPVRVAEIVAQDFNATGLLVGKVLRFRDVEKGGMGPPRLANVAFVLALYSAPEGRKLWVGRFDETQVLLTDNPIRARAYPGRGSRRLSALELAGFGAEKAIEAMTR